MVEKITLRELKRILKEIKRDPEVDFSKYKPIPKEKREHDCAIAAQELYRRDWVYMF